VMAAYQGALGAPPTFAQYTAAVNGIRGGAQTVQTLYLSLLGANTVATISNINALYMNLLNRTANPSMELPAAQLAGLAATFTTIIGSAPGAANNEYQSTGTFHTIAADHTNALYVRLLYYVILGRDPDLGGLMSWLGVANGSGSGILFQPQNSAAGAVRMQILGPGVPGQGFAGSPEFQSIFQ